MDFRSMFTPIVLSQGKNYFASGRVRDIVEEDNGFYITVRDSVNQYVSVILNGNILLGIGCTCQESAAGNHCKHEAACLFWLEKKLGSIKLPDPDEKKEKESSDDGRAENPVLLPAPSSTATAPPVDPASLSSLEALAQTARQGREIREENRFYPGDEDYEYFDSDRFTEGLHLSDQLVGEARQLIKSKAYKPLRVNLFYENGDEDGNLVGEAFLDSPEGDFRKWQANIRFDSDRITDSYCSSISCHYRYDRESYLERTLCRHQVAAILMTRDYLKKNNPGDATNSSGLMFINMMREDSGNSGEGESGYDRSDTLSAGDLTLRLEPLLTVDGEGLSASMRMGKNRLYKIKNIPETVKNIRLHREQVFGADTLLQLGREYIDPKSLPWLDWMITLSDEDQLRSRDHEERFRERSQTAREAGKEAEKVLALTDTVGLYGEKLENFYRIALETREGVETIFKSPGETDSGEGGSEGKTGKKRRKDRLIFEDANPGMVLEIHADMDPKKDVFRGIVLKGSCPVIYPGRNQAFYIEGSRFCRMDDSMYREMKPLFEVGRGGKVKVRIGRIHLGRFYRQILPRLRRYVDIAEYDSDIIAAHIPPAVEFLTCLDLEDNRIIARAESIYGERNHPLTDLFLEEEGEVRLASYRDREAEWELARLLSRYLPEHSTDYHIFYCGRKEDSVYDFLNEGLARLMELSEVHMTETFKRLKLRDRMRFRMDVSVGNNLMDLRIVSEDLSRSDLLELLDQKTLKKKYIRLENGDYFKIDENETVEALRQLMDNLEVTPREFVEGKMHIPAYRALYLEKMADQSLDLYLNRDEHFKELVRDFKTIEESDFALPPSLKEILRKYQKTGYRWMRTLDANAFGGILADDMGLGKTLQAITLLLADKLENMERSEEEPETTLIVCPASLVYNWEEELMRFAPQLITRLLVGTREERKKQIEDYKDVDVLITSYDLLRRDIDLYEECLFRFIIADEAQYIKNPGTAAAKSIKILRGVTRFALTGTPIENRLSELWSIFDFLMPGFLYDYASFRDMIEIPVTRCHDEKAAEMLKRMVTPFILRRMKEDVLSDLPEKMEEKLAVPMGEAQQHLYDGQALKILESLQGQTSQEFSKNRIRILADLMRLRQICCDPALCFEDYDQGSAKREVCMELIRSLAEGGHKALVFSQFTSMLDLLEHDLEEAKIPWYKITGSVSKAKRMELVKAFNRDDTPVFLISLKAGGTGLNLTGADVVIHYDPWWNTAAEDQATDRTHRIGQTRPVNVYRLIAKGSIEERIMDLQRSKKKLADLVMAAEETGSTMLDREDLLRLLEEQEEFMQA